MVNSADEPVLFICGWMMMSVQDIPYLLFSSSISPPHMIPPPRPPPLRLSEGGVSWEHQQCADVLVCGMVWVKSLTMLVALPLYIWCIYRLKQHKHELVNVDLFGYFFFLHLHSTWQLPTFTFTMVDQIHLCSALLVN